VFVHFFYYHDVGLHFFRIWQTRDYYSDNTWEKR